LAIKLKQVEGIQKGGARTQVPYCRSHPVEIRNAISAAHDALAIERHFDPKPGESLHDPGYPFGPLVATPTEDAHPVAIASADEPKTVVFNLIRPRRPDGAASANSGVTSRELHAKGTGRNGQSSLRAQRRGFIFPLRPLDKG
jgi:hypothetical protein